ncbi:hypothetical protein B9T64_06470 [Bacillus halotolerans]|uniref:hypothetical protein n=1 Tax=Bacillus halotolerans TaxID=260554 RepID=UPI000BFEBBDD|nr:hypothetical protein [Bacillus halotolerans]PHI49627.1 hypothetical protein B9T64_06470 [Bacillus halotolerans]
MKVTRSNYDNLIEGYIYEAGYHQRSRFKYTYETNKKILHVYDDLSYRSTSAENSADEIVSEIDKIIKGDSKGLKSVADSFISLFTKDNPEKIIFYTENGSLGISGVSKYGERLHIRGYDIKNKTFTDHRKDELYHEYVDIDSVTTNE